MSTQSLKVIVIDVQLVIVTATVTVTVIAIIFNQYSPNSSDNSNKGLPQVRVVWDPCHKAFLADQAIPLLSVVGLMQCWQP